MNVDAFVLGAIFVATVMGITIGYLVSELETVKKKIEFRKYHNPRRYRE